MRSNDARVINNTRLHQKQAKKNMKTSSNRKNKCEICNQKRAFRSRFLALWSLQIIGNTLKIALKVDIFLSCAQDS